MPYAVGYARFSSVKQGSGSSLQRQQELIANWIAANPDYTLYPRTFQDLGRSAYKGVHLEEKHEFGQLLAAIEAKEIKSGDVILVEAIDRIGRLTETKMIWLIHQIIEAGIKIITLQDNCEYGPVIKSEQIWSLMGKIQQAHQYSESLSDRIAKSYKNRERLAATGLTPKRRTPIWLNSDGTLKPKTAEAMKGAFEDALTGMGERRILRRLIAADPIFTKKNPTTVRRWLTNKTAIGYWREHKIYPPIVTDELFYQVQKRFEDNYKPATAPRKNFLSGLVKCGHCGSNMQVKANKHSPDSMNCSTRNKFGEAGCDNGKAFPIPVLLHICNDTATNAVDQAIGNLELSKSQKALIVIEGKLGEISRKIDNLGIAIQQCGLLPELQKQLTALIADQQKLNNQKLMLDSSTPEPCSRYEMAWDQQYELIESDPMRLNALLQSASYKLTCFPDGRVQSSTTGNQFSKCTYVKYDRKIQAYIIDALGEEFKLANREGTLTKARLTKFLQMLNQQRLGLPSKNNHPIDKEEPSTKEMYEFYESIT